MPHQIPHRFLDIISEDLYRAFFWSPEPDALFGAFEKDLVLVEQIRDVHFWHVGVEEEWAWGFGVAGFEGVFLGDVAVVEDVVVVGVVLDHASAVEVAPGIVVSDCTAALFNSVVRVSEYGCSGEKGFFVAFAHGALGEDGVEYFWAENVVIRAKEEGS